MSEALSFYRESLQPSPFVWFCLVCRENAKKKDVRTMNIEAAKAVADAVRTSLGPRGMDKMVSNMVWSPNHSAHALILLLIMN